MGDVERAWLEARLGTEIEITPVAGLDLQGTLLRYDDACLEVDVPGSGPQLIYRHAIMSLRVPAAPDRQFT